MDHGKMSNSQEEIPFLTSSDRDHVLELDDFALNENNNNTTRRDIGDQHSSDTGFDHINRSSTQDRTLHHSTSRSQLRRKWYGDYLLSCLGRVGGNGAWGRYSNQPQWKRGDRRHRLFGVLRRITVAALMLLGIIQLITLVLGTVTAFFPERFDYAFKTWQSREDLSRSSRWPTDYTADIKPVACHSHNDYWRRIPLRSAILAGCTGIEADVWLTDGDLRVGHAESALTPSRTFNSLYVEPLLGILDKQNPTNNDALSSTLSKNGVFDTDHAQTLVLLIDFKTSYKDLWPVVSAQLTPLRDNRYLTYFNGTHVVTGPVTVVVTGNAPFDYVVADMHYRDMFFDAPLDTLAVLSNSEISSHYDPTLELEYQASLPNSSPEGDDTTGNQNQNQGQGHSGHIPDNPAIYTRANSFYASVDFQASIGWPRPYLSTAQRDQIAAQIAGAHSRGLMVRYWNVPGWPIGLRNYLWRELVKMGVDYLNVDDLNAATHGDWRSGWSIWGWSLWGGRDW